MMNSHEMDVFPFKIEDFSHNIIRRVSENDRNGTKYNRDETVAEEIHSVLVLSSHRSGLIACETKFARLDFFLAALTDWDQNDIQTLEFITLNLLSGSHFFAYGILTN